MYELKTNTAVIIPVGPLVDPTDGKTAETALTVTDLSVQLYQIKTDGSTVVRTQFAPTASGGNNDMALVTSSTDGMYALELTAAQLNWLGCGRISFYDVDGFLVHWIDISVVSVNYFDHKYGTGNLNGDVIAWLGTAAHAATVAGIPVVQLHNSAGTGGINAPANFEDLSITDTTGLVACAASQQVDVNTIKTQMVTCGAGVTINPYVGLSAASGANLEASASVITKGTVDNSGFTMTTTEFEADDITTAAADHWNGRIIIFTSGTLAGQATDITDYAKVGSNGHFTVTALTSAPANDVTFVIV